MTKMKEKVKCYYLPFQGVKPTLLEMFSEHINKEEYLVFSRNRKVGKNYADKTGKMITAFIDTSDFVCLNTLPTRKTIMEVKEKGNKGIYAISGMTVNLYVFDISVIQNPKTIETKKAKKWQGKKPKFKS